jgi:hypothetical protein
MIEILVEWVPVVVTVASIVAAATPTPKDDEWLSTIYKAIDVLAVNIGKAKDK